VWRVFKQSLIDDAVDQWSTHLCACLHGNGGHLNISCDCQFVFSILDEVYVAHHAYAVGNIRRVHYKSMKCDVSFSQGSVSTLFRWAEHVLRICVKVFFLLTAVQKL